MLFRSEKAYKDFTTDKAAWTKKDLYVMVYDNKAVALAHGANEKLVGNPASGVLHGGVITTVLDNSAGVSVATSLPDMRAIATLDLRIDYMKPATPGRDVIAWTHCYKVGRNVAFVRGAAYHDDPNDPIATTAMTMARVTPQDSLTAICSTVLATVSKASIAPSRDSTMSLSLSTSIAL